MKKILMLMLLLSPLSIWAQDNSWERPEEEQEEETKVEKPNPNAKYLRGAVPLVNGKVVFSQTIDAPGKTAGQIFDIVKAYLNKMIGEKIQINSLLVIDDPASHTVGGRFEEWLVFKKNAIVLDQTRFIYTVEAKCYDGKAELELTNIRYLYEEERKPQHLKAEDWITDDNAVNKKNTRLYPITGKFRRKTIDRKDFIFNKIESLLK
jgi:colicin import membrane protein